MTMNAMPTSVTLSADEAAALKMLIAEALDSLREEIYKTENYDMRQDLKKRETLLIGLLERFGA